MAGATLPGTAGHLTLTLPAAVTEALLTRVPAAFHGGIERGAADRACGCGCGLVPAAAARRRRRRCGAAGARGSRPRGGVCGGRSVAHGGLVHQPVTRCGWIWAGSILRRRLAGRGCAGSCAQEHQGAAACAAGKGLGYGLLRYLNATTAGELGGFAAPQIGFNYLGRFAAGGGRRTGRCADEAVRLGGSDPSMPLVACVAINALTLDGPAGRG